MANEVYANGREVSCKAADGKSVACFPDVCLSPPSPPAGPVPIPYPNTGFASDTTDGSKTVKVSDKEVMLKDKSYFKKSTGDEAATKTLGMGVVTHQITGKVYFTSWSMDVKFEGENVVRALDLTTHNHASPLGNTVTWPYVDRMAMAMGLKSCEDEIKAVETNCKTEGEGKDKKIKARCPSNEAIKKAEEARARAKKKAEDAGKDYKEDPQYKRANTIVSREYEKFADKVNKNPCLRALRCILVPYDPELCCPGQTPHHVIDAASFLDDAEEKGQKRDKRPKIAGWKDYDVDEAPCVCAEGTNQTTATHGGVHVRTGVVALHKRDPKTKKWPRKDATDAGATAVAKTFPDSECSEGCLKAQLNRYHNKAKTSKDDRPIHANAEMTADEDTRERARKEMGIPSPNPTD